MPLHRRDVVLLLIGIDRLGRPKDSVAGITRLQKFLYLLIREAGLQLSGEDEFDFQPYKAGPYSSKLYDDLEFAENLGLLESEVSGEATDPEAVEVEHISFDELMGNGAVKDDGIAGTPDAFEERRYRLTPKGENRVKALLASSENQQVANGIRKIKSQYGNYSLSDLLYYVYTKYPEMTVESEIKDQVLRRRRR